MVAAMNGLHLALRVMGWMFALVSAIRGDWSLVLLAMALLVFDLLVQEWSDRQQAKHRALMDRYEQQLGEHLAELEADMGPEQVEAFRRAREEGRRIFEEHLEQHRGRWWQWWRP